MYHSAHRGGVDMHAAAQSGGSQQSQVHVLLTDHQHAILCVTGHVHQRMWVARSVHLVLLCSDQFMLNSRRWLPAWILCSMAVAAGQYYPQCL